MNTTLSAFSPAKINLFLHITGRRADGYHLLQSVFCPITLGDDVNIRFQTPLGKINSDGLVIKRTGDLQHIDEAKDLTVKACKAFYEACMMNQANTIELPEITIDVTKRTPEQAGLGGGSSNAATVLKLLQAHHKHPLDTETLGKIALNLGADVPFFLQNQCAFVEGIGETITPILGLESHFLVYKPPIACPTSEIFSDTQLTRNASDVKIAVFDSASRKNSEWFHFLGSKTRNVMQPVVEHKFPEWKQQFESFSRCALKHNALLVRMSGSGSAMFAAFASPSLRSKAMVEVAEAPELAKGQWFECQVQASQIERSF